MRIRGALVTGTLFHVCTGAAWALDGMRHRGPVLNYEEPRPDSNSYSCYWGFLAGYLLEFAVAVAAPHLGRMRKNEVSLCLGWLWLSFWAPHHLQTPLPHLFLNCCGPWMVSLFLSSLSQTPQSRGAEGGSLLFVLTAIGCAIVAGVGAIDDTVLLQGPVSLCVLSALLFFLAHCDGGETTTDSPP